jgi:hypothetical protein
MGASADDHNGTFATVATSPSDARIRDGACRPNGFASVFISNTLVGRPTTTGPGVPLSAIRIARARISAIRSG